MIYCIKCIFLNECCNFKIWILEYLNIRIYSNIRIISGIRIVLTGFEYYFRIRIFEYSTTALVATPGRSKFELVYIFASFWQNLWNSNECCNFHLGNTTYKKAQLMQGLHATAPSFQDVGCSKMAVSRHVGFYRTANSAIRSADPENPYLEPDMEWIGCTVCEIFAFKLYCHLETVAWGHSRSLKVAP